MKLFLRLFTASLFIAAIYVLIAGLLNQIFGIEFLLRMGAGTQAVQLPSDFKGQMAVFLMLLFVFLVFLTLLRFDVTVNTLRRRPWIGLLLIAVILGGARGLLYFHDRDIDSDLVLAMQAGRISSLDKLLSEGGAIDERRGDNESTLLMAAVVTQNVEMIEFLLVRGAQPNLMDRYGRTALMLAVLYRENAEQDLLEVVKVLLKHGADTQLKNREEMTAKDLARERGLNLVAQQLN
jgi:hypothetical protein